MSKKTKKLPNINARDFPTILGINPYQTPYQLLEDKIENKYPFFGNKFTEHGIKYEKSAIKVYEKQTGNSVDMEQKNIKHPEYTWITGRMDGTFIIEKESKSLLGKRKINSNTAINKKETYVLEIKCPLKDDRSEPLTEDNIPPYYWAQCQVYMNMIGCENTHYVEYYIKPDSKEDDMGKLYILNIKRDINWWNSSLPKIQTFFEEMKKYYELGSLETHPVRIAENEWQEKYKN